MMTSTKNGSLDDMARSYIDVAIVGHMVCMEKILRIHVSLCVVQTGITVGFHVLLENFGAALTKKFPRG